MTVTDLQRQQAKTPRHTTKTTTMVKAASNTSILTGGKACTKVSIMKKKISGALREWAPFAECIKKFLCSRAPPSSLQSGIKKFMSSDVLQHGVQREQDSPGGGGDFGLGGDIIGARHGRGERGERNGLWKWDGPSIQLPLSQVMEWAGILWPKDFNLI